MNTIVWRDWMANGTQARDGDGNPRHDYATCGECGRTWDDALITSLTPAPAGRCPFDPDRSPFTRRMADGHYIRTGHELEGYYLPPVDGIGELVRTCCA